MSTITAVSRPPRRPVSGRAVRSARWARAPIAGLAAALAATARWPQPAAAAPRDLRRRRARRCTSRPALMRMHARARRTRVPRPQAGPEGTLVYPLNPPAGMLTSAGYDAAFRACLKLAVTGGRPTARYRAIASHALRQAECMRAHGITRYPSPATIGGGIHSPDFTTLGLDTHTPQFQAAGRACGMAGGLWQTQWWWPPGRCSGDRRRGAQGGFGRRGPPAGATLVVFVVVTVATAAGLRRSGPGHQLQRGIRDRFPPLPRRRPLGDDRRGEGDPRATGRTRHLRGVHPGGRLSGDHDQPHRAGSSPMAARARSRGQ